MFAVILGKRELQENREKNHHEQKEPERITDVAEER
jgi:hypothetical protein